MASASDGTKKKKNIRYSRMKQPPLIKQLKGILSEYPDGGQILKELVQNAEDAGAREVKILFDSRRMNDSTSPDDASEAPPLYSKFFKGPALCVYNDAVFTDDDWEGIQMIYSSVKEEDPTKVGRFGLGFKSVFHITDFPCVISGDRVLLIDPQQSTEKVNATLDLCTLEEYTEEGMDADTFWKSLDNTFTLSRNTLDEDGFRGTLFWFPLREKMSELSETLYNKTKVEDLFDSFQSEASNILLFLKNIEKISLHIRDNDVAIREVISVEIEDADGTVRRQRNAFKNSIITLNSDSNDDDIHSSVHVTILMSSHKTIKRQEWLIVNYFVKKSASPEFKELIGNSSLGYSPYVGVAAPVNGSSEDFKGHVFCFLPLPREGERLTGLPVHVNGFFALSQNRHHMKWETEEQEGKQIDDKSILWNKALIEEALPKAYELLVLEAIGTAEKKSNEEAAISTVYNMMPLCEKFSRKKHKRWAILVDKLYKRLEMSSLVYASPTDGWIPISNACLATFKEVSGSNTQTQEAVIRCLRYIGLKYAKVPSTLFETLQKYFQSIEDLTPWSLTAFLKERDGYKEMVYEDKLKILEYILSDGENFESVRGLQLLPLASGKFEVFDRRSNAVYMCSDAAAKMFPGLECRFVIETTKLGTHLTTSFENICRSEIHQIQNLSVDCSKDLLQETILNHFGSSSTLQLTTKTSLTIDWLKNVWSVLVDRRIVKHFKDIPLVPVIASGCWQNPEAVELVKLTDFLVIKERRDHVLSDGLYRCLEAMSVKILSGLPDWIPFEFLQEFTFRSTKEGIVSLLGDIHKTSGENAVSSFNRASEANGHLVEALLQFVVSLAHIENNAIALLKKLRLFKAVCSKDNSGQYTSVSKTARCISEDIDFPNGVQFPFSCIKVERSREFLMRQLGADIISSSELVLTTVRKLLQSKNHDQTIILMNYLIENHTVLDNNTEIREHASQLPFLKSGNEWYIPSDLFDPTSLSLQTLLLGESLFPEKSGGYRKEEIRVLRRLGLKGEEDIDASVMLRIASRLNSWAFDSQHSADLSRKASAFMDVLIKDPHLLDKNCSRSTTFGNAIMNFACIPVKRCAPMDYPNGLPWFSESVTVCKPAEAKVVDLGLLAGATTPMIDCTSETLTNTLQWNLAPGINTVLEQMSFIRKHYNVNYKPDFTRAIQRIYKFMNQYKHDVLGIKDRLKHEALIWVGSTFEIPEKVIISQNRQDLDLTPYFHHLPEEFRGMDDLFLHVGCHQQQNNRMLLSVLQNIQIKHTQPNDVSICSIPRDTEIVLEVLTVLASRRKAGALDVDDSKILMLTEHDSTERLSLQLVSDCIFDDDVDELDPEEENSYYVIHSCVPVSVAKDLGVKSVKRKTILGFTEELSFEDWGQSESLTTRIRTLLRDSYKDGLSVPKELVQNADDAGAKVVKFLYDERVNDEARRREKLLTGDLEECQGPALWVYNDSLFTDEDLKNITKLNGATKADFQDKIGKFGLGFCSVYNLTDVPSFISNKDMVIFDPHESYLEEARQKRGKGLRIRLTKRQLVRRNLDQFKPYNAVFGCDILESSFTNYNGTLFRLPLRTEHQAEKSEICKEAYTKGDVSDLLDQLVENAGNIVLFTQNVTTIQIYHLSKHEKDPSRAKLIFSVKKNTEKLSGGTGSSNVESVLKRVPIILKKGEKFAEIHRVGIVEEMFDSPFSGTKSKRTYPFVIESKWFVSWSLGTNESLKLSRKVSDKGAIPLSSVAIQVTETDGVTPLPIKDSPHGFYTEGHLFCFLPLPIKTDLMFHINGCFSVTSDRRGLVYFTEDDKRKSNTCMWNQALMEDSLVRGYVNLLIYFSQVCSDNYSYSFLWPLTETNGILSFKHSFYKTLLFEKPKLFKGVEEWLSVDQIIFLDPSVRSSKSIGDTAFEMLCSVPARSGKGIIEMSSEVLKELTEKEIDSRSIFKEAMISEEEFIIHFLNTIDSAFWYTRGDKRNRLVLYALKLKSKRVFTKLQETKCIPSEPDYILRRPKELINPKSEIADMFSVADGKFPQKADGFCEETVLGQLVTLGMNDQFIPEDMLIQRCKCVEETIKVCGYCARDRCCKILRYCGKSDVLQQLDNDEDTTFKIKSNMLLPIMPRPKLWTFTWNADTSLEIMCTSKCELHKDYKDTILFGKPVNLYRESLYNCSGSVCSFVDESYLKMKCSMKEGVFSTLGIKCELTIDLLSQQLMLMSDQYVNPDQQISNLEKISRSVYDYIVRLITDKSEEEISSMQWFVNMRERPTILIGKELVKPCKVAFNIKEECPQELYRLREVDSNRKKMFRALGVTNHFSVTYLISILQRMYNKWFQSKCTDIDTMTCLLRTLWESMCKEKVTFESLKNNEADIVAPDLDGYLRPTTELIIDDPDYKSSATLHILHGKVSPDTGRALGVKSKQRKIVECLSTAFFMPFGQNESLVTRLNGILEDYPCDSSIMKELIQNADDAGATEIHFIKNYIQHPSEKVFGNKEMQGPALCIFNNSSFTEKDFEGIRNLGIGSKREDPSKTGQYGIGFNAVYHLTDIPSFLTKGPGLGKDGQICIFDPLMTYLEDHVTKENPGIKCDTALVEESFPDMLLGYPFISSIHSAGKGTMFRLPLRQRKSDVSSNIVSAERMDNLIEEFKLDMFECLLFLKSIKCIKVLRNTKQGLIEEFVVETKMSPEDTLIRSAYYSEVKEIARANVQTKHRNLCMQPIECSYTVNIEDSKSRNEQWLIINRFGFEHIGDKHGDLVSALKDKMIGLMPVASVALPLPKENWKDGAELKAKRHIGYHKDKEERTAFCFLPLPLKTGLPLHVNGHFALDKSRTKLWDEGIRECWNKFLIEELITRAWISAIQCMKKQFVEKYLPEMSEEIVRSAVFEIYHEQFPLWDRANDKFWKTLVSSFYRILIGEYIELFPTFQITTSGQTDCLTEANEACLTEANEAVEPQLEWVALSKSENDFGGMFNVISQSSTLGRTDRQSVEKILKKMGMKIIETPLTVSDSVKFSDVTYVPTCSPELVIQFLKTFDDPADGSCQLGGINISLRESAIYEMKVLENILEYVMSDETFVDKVEGLPLCLTHDGLLHIFSTEAPVYNSRMCDVLTGSAHQFIHSDLVTMTDQKEFYDACVIRRFSVDDFVSIIHETFCPSSFATGDHLKWNKQLNETVKPEILLRIFNFIYNESVEKSSSFPFRSSLNHETFQANLQKLNVWSLLPSCCRNGTENTYELIPISKTWLLFHFSSGNYTVSKLVLKFNIPVLDTSVFSSKEGQPIIYPLQKLLPSTEHPTELLECLFYYKDRFQGSDLTCNEGLSLLSYFDDKIDQMKEKMNENSLKQKLKSLPLYVSYQGTSTSIDQFANVIVLPCQIPTDGIDMWAQKTGNLLLKDTDKLDKLYEFLDLSRMTDLEIYIDKLVPSINHLPRKDWCIHVRYMKDILLVAYSIESMDVNQRRLVEQLKRLPFVNVAGKDKKVSELYDHHNPVFACMLEDDSFLPEEYKDYSWANLMRILGLITKPTGEMLIEFALELQQKLNSPISDKTKEQSSALVDCLYYGKWPEQILQRIRTIRFVVPHQVDRERKSVATQPENGNILICLSGTASHTKADYCWSSMNLLSYLPNSDQMLQSLGIFKCPPVDKIVQHCQNVADIFKVQLENRKVRPVFVKYIMEKLYRILLKKFIPSMKQNFQVTPLMFHPDDEAMVSVKQIVINLTSEEEITPFLYKLPTCFGPYEELFTKLGSQTVAVCSNYSMVLETIKLQFGDKPVPANSLRYVKMALENMVRLLAKESVPVADVNKLYIPDRNQVLRCSKELTVSNNADIEQRLKEKIAIDFFLGFKEMEIECVIDPVLPFLKFPLNIRPDILTTVVSEQISTDEVNRQESVEARHLENCLRSPHFVEGVLRLTKHQMRLKRKHFEKSVERKYMKCLTNVRITKVSGLKTFLTCRGRKVDGTDRDATCFIKSELQITNDENYDERGELEEYELYFQMDAAEDLLNNLIDESDGLVKLIDMCTDSILEKHCTRHLFAILRLLKQPTQIETKLDQLKIDAYALPTAFALSVFPRPGTYVEEKFHPFLEQSISPFKRHEFMYVALEIEDDDATELVYIYANIISENKRRQGETVLDVTYTVDVGLRNDRQIIIDIPIYRLYRFKARQTAEENALVAYDIEPIGSIPIDENFRRVRNMLKEAWRKNGTERRGVIRRLLTRWHPDRNREHREYAERLFNYVKEVVIKLENNEVIDDIITNETGRMQPDMSRSSFRETSCAVDSRGDVLARGCYDNIDEYNRSTNTGKFIHYKAATAVVRHIGEAKRWIRQAVQDFKAAESNLSTGKQDKSFNWVCYKCHQASEKALKAAWFSKNANRATSKEHSLRAIAVGLDDGSFMEEAVNLESVTGDYFSMRYPDAVVGHQQTPSEMFDSTKAEQVLHVTKRILDMASEYIA